MHYSFHFVCINYANNVSYAAAFFISVINEQQLTLLIGCSAAVSGTLAGELPLVERMRSWQRGYTMSNGRRWSARNCSAGCSVLLPVCCWRPLVSVCFTCAVLVHQACMSVPLAQLLLGACSTAHRSHRLDHYYYCVPVSEVASRDQLRSASLLIPRYRLRTFGRRAFAVAVPTFWNLLADELRTYSSDRFKPALKTFLFATSVFSALEAFAVMRYINWWLTLTLTTFIVIQ